MGVITDTSKTFRRVLPLFLAAVPLLAQDTPIGTGRSSARCLTN
jgi:hypothetical protein